jgi:hypothetical protein
MIAKSMRRALIGGSCEITQNIQRSVKQRAQSGKRIRINFSIGSHQRKRTVNSVNQRCKMSAPPSADRKGMRRLQCEEPRPIISSALSERSRSYQTVPCGRNIVFHLNLRQLRDQTDEPASPESARRGDAASNLIVDSDGEMAPDGEWMDPAVASRQVTLHRTNRTQRRIVEITATNETNLSPKGWTEELDQSLLDRRASESSGNFSDKRN